MGVTGYDTYQAYKKILEIISNGEIFTKPQIEQKTKLTSPIVNRIINDLEYHKIVKIKAHAIFVDDSIIKCKSYQIVEDKIACL